MIEISHQQARRLIREGMDDRLGARQRLTEAQWAALQDHLEGCADCRAYRDQLVHIERDARRVLRLRWSNVGGPGENLPLQVLRRRKAALARRRFGRDAARYGLLLLAVLVFFGVRRLLAPAQPAPDSLANSNLAATRLATPYAGLSPEPPPTMFFRGRVAYESHADGNGEIYLFNAPGGETPPERINLTQSPANDTYPAWSPDGDWLAFLSDRSGKPELYVMNVSGTRLTRLTDDPGVAWQGPLTWSSDGRWIGLRGEVNLRPGYQAGEVQSWLFVVPLYGGGTDSGPLRLANTRGAPGPLKFSPTDPVLAYQSSDYPAQLMLYQLETGQMHPVSLQDYTDQLATGAQDGFGWAPDGRWLAYLAEGVVDNRFTTQLKMTDDVFTESVLDGLQDDTQLLRKWNERGAFRSTAFSPAGDHRTIAYLQDEDRDGCWTVHLAQPGVPHPVGDELPGLCVESRLDRSSWTPDGGWLVTLARRPGEKTPAVYALAIPPAGVPANQPPHIERLADVQPDGAGPAPVAPAVRPAGVAGSAGQLIGLAAAEPAPTPEPQPQIAIPPDGIPGDLLYFSSDMKLLNTKPGEWVGQLEPPEIGNDLIDIRCPAVSPVNPASLVFVASRRDQKTGNNEIYWTGPDGKQVIPLTRPEMLSADEEDRYSYFCPAWSPDGRRLAVVLQSSTSSHLAIVPVQPAGPIKLIALDTSPSGFTSPRWIPRGARFAGRVLVPLYSSANHWVTLAAVDPDGPDGSTAVLGTFPYLETGWSDVYGMEYSPDGKFLAAIFLRYDGMNAVYAQLRVLDTLMMESRYLAVLYDFFPTWGGGVRPIAWRPDGSLGVAYALRRSLRYKSTVAIFNPADNTQRLLARGEDLLYNVAWSPDGNWAAYTTESGLWLLDARPASVTPAPLIMDGEPVHEVIWRKPQP